ncbi:hypothetical protein [Roseibium album]|uniref:hypothetical protein n=1 Tax=Roseibium album TaxID=311410 RepID=UPI00391CD0A9
MPTKAELEAKLIALEARNKDLTEKIESETNFGSPQTENAIYSRYGKLLGRVWLTALLLGLVAGFLSGFSRSPIAGVIIPGVLAVVSAGVALSADRLTLFRLRWAYFSEFAIVFIIAFSFALAGGMYVKNAQPSSVEEFADTLRELGLSDREIAEKFADTVVKSSDAIRLFDSGFVLYSTGTSTTPNQSESKSPSQATCDRLRPPLDGYSTIAMLGEFRDSGTPFTRIADFVERADLSGSNEPESTKLLMLEAAHYGACGP